MSIASQPGKDWRQHQTIAGSQAGAALTLQPDLHAAQAVQHAGQATRDTIAGLAESRVRGRYYSYLISGLLKFRNLFLLILD